jgi:hypothetical protein
MIPRWIYDPRPKSYLQQALDQGRIRAILFLAVLLAFLA